MARTTTINFPLSTLAAARGSASLDDAGMLRKDSQALAPGVHEARRVFLLEIRMTKPE
jgi:hypothetical protein